jgi:hypothetical protein
MTPEQVNGLLSLRRFWRYVVDGDEILIQHLGTHLDGEPHWDWIALLNRGERFEEWTRWETYEAARMASGNVSERRSRQDVDVEMRWSQTDHWYGVYVPTDVDEAFGCLTMAAWSGPRSLRERRALQHGSD